jgi:hypothetical protein
MTLILSDMLLYKLKDYKRFHLSRKIIQHPRQPQRQRNQSDFRGN